MTSSRQQDDTLLSQHLDQHFGEHNAPIRLLGQFSELVDAALVVGDGEQRQVPYSSTGHS